MKREELTFEEFGRMPLTYTIGMTGDVEAQRMYRNEELGVQKEVYTKRLVAGDIYSGWHDGEVYYYLDGDDRQFRTVADLYVGYMENVCGVKP